MSFTRVDMQRAVDITSYAPRESAIHVFIRRNLIDVCRWIKVGYPIHAVNWLTFTEAIVTTVEPPLTVPLHNGHLCRSRPLFLADSPYIDPCLNLSSKATSTKTTFFLVPRWPLCSMQGVYLYLPDTNLIWVKLINWSLAQGIQTVECAMTLESGKIIRKRRGWRKRGGLGLHGFVFTPYPIPLRFFLLTSLCNDSRQSERLEHARFIWAADQQKAATNICPIVKWKESQEGV